MGKRCENMRGELLQLTELAAELLRRIGEFESKSTTGQVPAQQSRLLTAKQAAEYLGRSEQAVRHLIFQRDIPVVRRGRCVRIDRKDLDNWIENNKA